MASRMVFLLCDFTTQVRDMCRFRQRTVTRGVNRNVKEDFRVSLEKQVARNNEKQDDVIKEFLQNERDSLIRSFS